MFYYYVQRQPLEVCCKKKVFLKILQYSQKLFAALEFFLIKLRLLKKRLFTKKETLAQVFSCEFCEFFKSNFFTEHLRVTASVCLSLSFFQPISTERYVSYKYQSFDFIWNTTLDWNRLFQKFRKGFSIQSLNKPSDIF